MQLALEGLEDRSVPAVWTITTSSDVYDGTINPFQGTYTEGPGGKLSLPEALAICNVYGQFGPIFPGPNTIRFNISEPLPAQGFWTLTNKNANFGTEDPIQVSNGLTIDGYSQSGSAPNTLADGSNATIRIYLNGAVQLRSSGNAVRGIATIGVETLIGVAAEVSNNVLAGNFIGLKPDGQPIGNPNNGVKLGDPGWVANNNLIGGPDPADRNVIAASAGSGIWVENGVGNCFQGNLIYNNNGGGIHNTATGNPTAAPVLAGAAAGKVTGTFQGAQNKAYTIEVFGSMAPDAGNQYEGEKFLARKTVTTNGTGQVTFNIPAAVAGKHVTVTASEPTSGTSAFSNAVLGEGGAGGEVKILGVAPKYAHVAAPGEDAWVTIKIENKTGETLKAAAGTALVKVYTGLDKTKLLTTYTVPDGKTETLGKTPWTKKLKFQFPAIGDVNEIAPGQYTYYVELDPVWKGKTGASAEPFDFVNQFGKVGDRKDVEATIKGASSIPGTAAAASGTVTFSLKGGGTGTVTVVGGKTNLSFAGTTSKTRVSADDVGAPFQVHDITVNDDLDFLDLGQVDADGTLSFDGDLGKLNLRSFGGAGSSLTLTAGSNEPASLSLGSVHDTTITAFRPIDRLDVYEWVDNDGNPETLSAPSIGRLSVEPGSVGSGDFEVSMTLSGPAAADGLTLGKATVAGTLYNSAWTIGQPGSALAVGSIQAARASDWTLAATGRVGAIEVAGDWLNTMTAVSALKAATFGQITVGGDLFALGIEATGAAAKSNLAIGGFKAKTVSHLDVFTADQGGISKIEVAGWDSSTAFKAKWIKSLKTTIGNFTANLELTGTNPKSDEVSLDEAKVAGVIGGTWKVFGDVESVEAGGAAGLPTWDFRGGLGLNSPGTLLRALTVHTGFDGTIKTDAIGKITVAGIMNGAIEVTLPVPIKSITLGTMIGFISTPGDIGKLTAGQWEGSAGGAAEVDARQVKHLLITGAAQLGTFNLSGGAGTFIVGSMVDCTVNAPGQTIALFLVTGIDGATGPMFSRTDVTAGTLGIVQLKDVDEDPIAPDYGIKAGTVLAYSRSKDGKAVELVDPVDGKKKHVLHFPSPGVADKAGNYTLTITP